ncbi:serine/threonine protein kinase [Terracoccus luteus]|uniref:Serine/threonine protein kinase n=1 Tax=Terracoccus luteus TaxID=53356 RepID=A0A495XXV5_9MICO|nr:serine/threonine-protein kinase [Terracoccus luteus]RKT79430.1 serine/threonine protein kinase [Terracoccus luteus]
MCARQREPIDKRNRYADHSEAGDSSLIITGSSGRTWKVDPTSIKRGGFGDVYHASASDNGAPVAVKRVALPGAADNLDLKRRQREFDIGELLQFAAANGAEVEHLLVPLDTAEFNNELFLVMPRADGNLDELRGEYSDLISKIHVLIQVVEGLVELSGLGILHRDLKPSNVLRVGGVWKVADFGMSRNLEESTASHSFMGAGTRPYMAPEIWTGQRATVKTDLYALGVLTYELLEGQRPFVVQRGDDWPRVHREKEPSPLPLGNPTLQRLTLRLLNKDPAKRPRNAQDVLDILRSNVSATSTSVAVTHLAQKAADREVQMHRSVAVQNRLQGLEARLQAAARESFEDLKELAFRAADELRSQIPDAVAVVDDDEITLNAPTASLRMTVSPAHHVATTSKPTLWQGFVFHGHRMVGLLFCVIDQQRRSTWQLVHYEVPQRHQEGPDSFAPWTEETALTYGIRPHMAPRWIPPSPGKKMQSTLSTEVLLEILAKTSKDEEGSLLTDIRRLAQARNRETDEWRRFLDRFEGEE